jgi:hypothetical protein
MPKCAAADYYKQGELPQEKGRRQAAKEAARPPSERDLVQRTTDRRLGWRRDCDRRQRKRAVRALRRLACVSGASRCGKRTASNTLHTLRVDGAPISGQRVRFVFRQQMPSPKSQRLAHDESSPGRTCCDFARCRSPGAALVRCSIAAKGPRHSAGGRFVLYTCAHVDTMHAA